MSLRDILFGILLFSFLPSGYAQKRNVENIWTIQIIPADNYQSTLTPTIVGGPGDPTIEVIYDPKKAPGRVTTSVCAPGETGGGNVFALQITNLDPYALKPEPGSHPLEWISFANIFMAEDAYQPYQSKLPTDRLSWLGPILVEKLPGTTNEHYLWPLKDNPDYIYSHRSQQIQAVFMNEGPHPRQFYDAVHLHVSFSGFSFLDMALQDTKPVSAKFGIAIWAKRDCDPPQATGIGMHIGEIPDPQMYPAYITRTDTQQWKLDLNQPTLLYEYGYRKGQAGSTGETQSACSIYLSGGQWTTPIRFSLIVTHRSE